MNRLTKHMVSKATANLATRGLASRVAADGETTQMIWLGGTTPDVEIFQGQGVHFRAPNKSEGIGIAPGGVADSMVMLGVHDRKSLPGDALEFGEGGLHYLGEWRVFLAADGTVSLGAKSASDFVALASLTKARIDALQQKLDALITKFNTHTHIYSPGPSPAAPTAVPAVIETVLGAQAAVASTTIKAE